VGCDRRSGSRDGRTPGAALVTALPFFPRITRLVSTISARGSSPVCRLEAEATQIGTAFSLKEVRNV
jgi:hypothetical protein